MLWPFAAGVVVVVVAADIFKNNMASILNTFQIELNWFYGGWSAFGTPFNQSAIHSFKQSLHACLGNLSNQKTTVFD